jgi:hypothetical protein
MRKLRGSILAGAVLVGLAASTMSAQDLGKTAKNYNFEIRPTIGVVFGLSDDIGTGWDIGGSLRAMPKTWPVGVQLDLILIDIESTSVFQFTPAVVYPLSTASETFDPYLIGGLGLYDGDFGINAGVGADIAISGSPLGFFAETRFHNVFASGNSYSLLPVNVGVRIRF